MSESEAQADLDVAPFIPRHARPPSPEATNPTILQQAIKGMVRDWSPSSRPEHEFIDPKKALADPFGLSGTAQLGWPTRDVLRAGQLQTATTLSATAFSHLDPGLASCDEDADGELDDSFQSQESFWAAQPQMGDTSVSTVDTVDLDDSPVPLLGRDGRWKGKAPSRTTIYYEPPPRQQERDDEAQSSQPLALAFVPTERSDVFSAPYEGTRHRRAASNSSSNIGGSSRSPERKRKTLDEHVMEEPVTPVKAKKKSKSKRKSKEKKRKHSGSSTKGTPSKKSNSGDRRHGSHASSELSHFLSTEIHSSPASSTGRYKLRNKASVPVLSLAALLSPQGNNALYSSDKAAHGADSHDGYEKSKSNARTQIDDEPPSPAEHAAPSIKADSEHRAREQQAETDVEAEIEAKTEDANDANDEGWTFDPDLTEDVKHEDFTSPASMRNRGRRQFPPSWEIHPDFPFLYPRYSVPSSVSPEVLEMLLRHLNYAGVDDTFHEIVDRARTSHGAFNKPRSILDLYTPRFVKGVSAQKVGMCPVCYEDGRVKFLKTKFSAYNYHLQNFHGISALTGLPFTPPSKFRIRKRSAKPRERGEIIQGLCHSCKKYIDMQGPKETDVKVAEIYWWKHAQACHKKSTTPEGVGGWFVEDKWFERVGQVLQLVGGVEGEVQKLMAGSR